MADHPAPGLFASLKGLLADLLEVGRTRLDLLANEVEEEKLHLGQMLAYGMLALAALIIGAILLVAFLALLFWENRLWVVGIACACSLLLGLRFARRSQAELKTGSRLFKASVAELEADVTVLRARQKNTPEDDSGHESTPA